MTEPDYETIIDHHHAAALMGYANQIDSRVQATHPNADVWSDALRGGTYGLALDVIREYYKRYDPKQPDMKPITPGYVRSAAIQRREYQQNKQRSISPPPPRKGGGPPPHVRKKLDEFYAQVGYTPKERA